MTKPIEKWANFQWPSDEIWRSIAGFPGYEASDHGRIRTLRKGNPRLRIPEIDKDGYYRMSIQRDGRYVHVVLHRLICEVFKGAAPEGKPVCCHEDNDKTNNRPGNLRWDTQAGNIADKVRHGTHQIGSKHGSASCTEKDVAVVIDALRNGATLGVAAKAAGVSFSVAASVSSNKAWKHVGGDVGEKIRRRRKEGAVGELHPNAIFTNEQAISIVQKFRQGVPASVLAKQFGTSYAHAWRIATRRIWRHLCV